MTSRVLIAGIGNVFHSDDGFGVEVISRLSTRDLPPEAVVADYGIRGMHLAYELLDGGYEFTIFVDTDYETCIARARVRKQERLRSADEIEARYRERYMPGFMLYVAEVQPHRLASWVL